jgi:phenylpropionate dioxygenase-like ring-hydroxylating dioxygenase large terminal subunit
MNLQSKIEKAPGPAALVQETYAAEEGTPDVLRHASVEEMGVEDIPKERYTSRAFHEAEVEKMWSRVWHMACWAEDIPSPGDVYVYDINETSVILVRQTDGSIKAFHNSCLHRGRPLCDENTRKTALRCPFHGFTWNLDGSLKTVPSAWDFPQVREQTHKLPQARVDLWNGFVFINLSDDAPPLDEYLEDLPQHFAGSWDLTKRYKALHVEKVFPANWKLTLEAFIEAFHIFATHPGSITFSADEQSQYDIYPGKRHYTRGISMLGITSGQYPGDRLTPQQMIDRYLKEYFPEQYGTEGSKVLPGESGRDALGRIVRTQLEQLYKVDLSKTTNSEVIDGVWYHVFPNFMVWPTLSYPLVYRFRPHANDHEQSVMDIWLLFPFEGERPPSAPIVRKEADEPLTELMGRVGVVFDEDLSNLAVIQKGVKANVRGGFSVAHYQEARIRHYHRTLMDYIEG